MKRLLRTSVLATAVVVAATAAGASALSAGSKKLGTGTSPVTPCGSLAAATVSYNIAGGNVTKVVIGNLPASCNGGQLSLMLTTGGTDAGHGGPAVVSGGTATVGSLSATPAATSVTNARITITGP